MEIKNLNENAVNIENEEVSATEELTPEEQEQQEQ
jgi:hypothetical protein